MSEHHHSPQVSTQWPNGKAFAFTVFDDTDLATVANVRPAYDLLRDLGFRTSKSVWSVRGDHDTHLSGETCDDPGYLRWTLDLQAAGFEIASHGATYNTSARARTIEAFERFREHYGHYPRALANHSGSLESIYWGAARVSGLNRLAYHAMTRFRRVGQFRGHVESDPLFWGDICQARIDYVRNFTFDQIDTLAACPFMPYHDPARPYVNKWFASSEGANVRAFNAQLAESRQETLEEQGGACIMYTHFAAGFVDNGKVDRRFVELMTRLARRGGWFVPVSTLLDQLADTHGHTDITPAQRRGLERRWLRSKVRVGPT